MKGNNKAVVGLAELLKADGIEVCESADHDDWFEVEFRGTFDTAARAKNLAQERGYYPQDLVGHWPIRGGDFLECSWTLLFGEDSERGDGY